MCQTKLSRLCEQDKTVRMQEEKLQQLHREKVQPPSVFDTVGVFV